MAWKKERSCVWMIQFYLDNERHIKALEFVRKNYSEYAYILHQPESDEKKEHYHVVVRFKNYRWNTALAEELDVEINMFEKVRGLDNALIYLTHIREPDKIQYSVEDIEGPFQSKVKRLIQTDGKDNTDKAKDIVDWINSQPREISYNALFYYCSQNGLYGELVRAMKLFSCILEEHNRNYYEESVVRLKSSNYPF